jgi:hypothetical protein
MTMRCARITCNRAFILFAAVALAACSRSSKASVGAQIMRGSGGSTAAGWDGSAAGLEAGITGPWDSATGSDRSPASIGGVTGSGGAVGTGGSGIGGAVVGMGVVGSDAGTAGPGDTTECPVVPVGASCIGDLSNTGSGDFKIAFTVTTMQTNEVALVNQRSTCDHEMFWDIRMLPGGGVVVETCETTSPDTYESVWGGGPINDGKPHEVLAQRIGGVLALYVDCVRVGSVRSTVSFTSLAAFVSGVDVCDGKDGTVALVGTLANVCVSRL